MTIRYRDIKVVEFKKWLNNPKIRLNPHLQAPFDGEQTPEFYAWNDGAKAMLDAVYEACGIKNPAE